MAGPIISGGSPKLEAFFFMLMVVILMVIIVPELTSLVVSKLPWAAPILYWLREAMEKHAMHS